MKRRSASLVLSFVFIAALRAASAAPPQRAPVISVDVDARDAARGLFHTTIHLPASPGMLTFYYPEWIPGEHTPTGPLMQVAGLTVTAGGNVIPWTRDPLDMFTMRADVPQGATAVDIVFDYLSGASTFGAGYGESPNATSELLDLPWNHVLVYPAGSTADTIRARASVRLPAGWKFDTALPVTHVSADRIDFAEVSLTTLIDSPLIAGRHYRNIEVEPGPRGLHVGIVADSKPALALPEERIAQIRQLVKEADALFGARHYDSYRWLVTLSDSVEWQGLEHHQSSDNRFAERAFIDETQQKRSVPILAHEFTHSWNGKYRRPAGLATADYQQPMQGELLWVYEGMTRYIGDFLLASRSGIRTPDEVHEWLAWVAANLDRNRPGRATKSLADTAVGVQVISAAPPEWATYRRGLDYYDESLLVWLDADALIRKTTSGRKSMDDFIRAFFGAPASSPMVKPYTLDDVVATLESIAPTKQWRTFLRQHVYDVTAHPPLGALEASGWKLVYDTTPNGYLAMRQRAFGNIDLSFTLGMWVKSDGTITDVVPGRPALDSGLAPGMKVLAVNGRKWTSDVIHEELAETHSSHEALEIVAEQGTHVRTFKVSYDAGDVYPHLERVAGQPDTLGELIRPRAR